MRIFIIVIATLILLSPSSSSTDTKGWRGIVPLRSARADVEALLGEGTNQCKCSYYLDDMNLFFVYSSGNCGNGGSGKWNVAPDTVIRFTLSPKVKPKLSDLNIDESQFEKRQDIGDGLIYINHEEGFSIEVQGGKAMSFDYGPGVGDVHLRCPGYHGINYSPSIPEELRERLLERLNQFVHYSFTGQYEEQYGVYLPEFAAKVFPAKNKREFAKWARTSGALNERWVEFKPKSITVADDETYGKVYDVYGRGKTTDGQKVVESYRTTRLVLRGGEFYFVELFNLMPM